MGNTRNRHQFCSIGDSRSFVDSVSNLGRISSIDLGKHLNALWNGTLPAEAMPTAIHEAAHHDHLRSPVGEAFAAIHLHIRQIACGLTKSFRVTSGLPGYGIEDLKFWSLRYEAAVAVIRPFSEGLACLAQLDCLPSQADSNLSFALQFAQVIAVRKIPEVIRQDALRIALTSVRLSNELLDKRADIYADGFHCRDGGYLAGYLLMRLLWTRCAALDSRFEFSETFVSMIRHVVFCDYQLVTLMLSQTFDPSALARQLATRICWRLMTLAGSAAHLRGLADAHHVFQRRALELWNIRKNIGPAYRQSFEEMTGRQAPSGVNDLSLGTFIYNDPDDCVLGYRLLEQHLVVGQTANRFRTDADAVVLNGAVWERRGWFWLGSHPVVLSAAGEYVQFDSATGISGTLPRLADANSRYTGNGWLTCAYSPRRGAVVLAAGVQESAIAAGAHWGQRDEEFESAMRLLGEQSALIRLDVATRTALEKVRAKWRMEPLLAEVRADADEITTRRIAGVLLPSASDEEVDRFLSLTREDGLAGMTSTGLLRACALLSSCASAGMLTETARPFLKSRGYDLDQVIPRIAEFLRPLGGECQLDGDRIRISL